MYEEDRQEHGWMTFRIGEEKMLIHYQGRHKIVRCGKLQ